jgi:hypothetical protein
MLILRLILMLPLELRGASCAAVGWGTAPQDGRFRVRLQVGSLEIFKWPTPSVRIQ